MSEAIRTALAMIEQRLAELEPEVAELRNARAAILNGRTSARRTSARRSYVRRPIAARMPEILAFIREHPGCGVAEVAHNQGLTITRTAQILSRLKAEGKVRHTEHGLELAEG